MALIRCDECGKTLNNNETVCLNCDNSLTNKRNDILNEKIRISLTTTIIFSVVCFLICSFNFLLFIMIMFVYFVILFLLFFLPILMIKEKEKVFYTSNESEDYVYRNEIISQYNDLLEQRKTIEEQKRQEELIKEKERQQQEFIKYKKYVNKVKNGFNLVLAKKYIKLKSHLYLWLENNQIVLYDSNVSLNNFYNNNQSNGIYYAKKIYITPNFNGIKYELVEFSVVNNAIKNGNIRNIDDVKNKLTTSKNDFFKLKVITNDDKELVFYFQQEEDYIFMKKFFTINKCSTQILDLIRTFKTEIDD